MDPKEKPVFVTGGTGLLGSHLICRLILQGYRVRAIHRNTSNRGIIRKVADYYGGIPEELFFLIEWIECDLDNFDLLLKAMEGTGFVYHCAATVSFESPDRENIIKNNVRGTINVVRACILMKSEKLCYVSSTAALGASDGDFMVNEGKKWNEFASHSAYGLSKHLSEEEIWKGIEKGLRTVIVNPSIILGPGDWKRSSTALFSNIEKGMIFYTNGMTGYVDVNDVARAMITLTESSTDGERFIINSENLSYGKLFRIIARNLGVRQPFIRVPKIMSYIAGPLIDIYEKLTGKKSPLTKEMVSAAWSRISFDNSKIISRTGMEFTPIEKSVRYIADIYNSEKKRNEN
jgi:dihydroflavonol-4-reductase